MGFIQPSSFCTFALQRKAVCLPRIATHHVAPVSHIRMGVGEDGLKEDLELAQNYIENGCTETEAVRLLQVLEQRRAVLSLEVTKTEDAIEKLAELRIGEDKTVVQQAMEAAMGVFSPSQDDYPSLDKPTGYTMDKPKKK